MNRLVRTTAFAGLIMVLVTGCAFGPEYEVAPFPPVNMSPTEQADVVVNAQTTFVWQTAANATFYQFHIFNNASNDITQHARTNLQSNDVCENGQCRVTLAVALPYKKNHAWRVRAGNNAGFSGWTRTRFNMVGSGENAGTSTSTGVGTLMTPSTPRPVSPNGIDVESETLVEFVWRAIPEATGYDFHIFDAVNTQMVDVLNDMPATTVCQSRELCRITRTVKLSPSDAHVWRIRAVNQNGQSTWTRSNFNVVR